VKSLDEQIKKDLVDQLYWDSRVDAANVNAEVNDGIVTLSGTVPNYSARQAAAASAWTTPGVVSVNNEIKVDYQISVPDDRELQERINRLLDWNPVIDAREFNVSVEAGWVTVEGSVDTLWKKDRVEELVMDITGVVGITNKVAVVPTENILDEEIGESILGALDRNAEIDVNLVDVKVENATVKLSGTVPSRTARRAAYEAALFTQGVNEIVDNLVVFSA
jgi:osmotically-inducible protein OsmY